MAWTPLQLQKLEDAKECGEKAAIARHKKDEMRARGWHEHFVAIVNSSPDSERAALNDAYNITYRTQSEKYRPSLNQLLGAGR